MPGASILRLADLGRAEVGYHECPHNAAGRCIFSGRVESAANHTKYGEEYGFNGVAWCCIFASVMANHAGALYLGRPFHFASTIAARDHAKRAGRWSTKLVVGAFSMMAHSATTGHFGFILAIYADGSALSWEGNTNAQGSREGNVVALRRRAAGSWDGCIILDETLEATPAPTPPSEEDADMASGFKYDDQLDFITNEAGSLVQHFYSKAGGWATIEMAPATPCAPGAEPAVVRDFLGVKGRLDVGIEAADGGLLHCWYEPGDAGWNSELNA